MPGYCSFDKYETKNRGTVYKLRFDKLSCVTLGDKTHAQLYKSNDYILVKPVHMTAGDARNTFLVSKHKSNAIVNVGRLVTNGFFHKDLFGRKYVVKKDRKGNLYICLNEVVEESANDK